MLRRGVMADMTVNTFPVSNDISKNPVEQFGELFESECGVFPSAYHLLFSKIVHLNRETG